MVGPLKPPTPKPRPAQGAQKTEGGHGTAVKRRAKSGSSCGTTKMTCRSGPAWVVEFRRGVGVAESRIAEAHAPCPRHSTHGWVKWKTYHSDGEKMNGACNSREGKAAGSSRGSRSRGGRTHMRSNLSRRNSYDDLYVNDSAAEERRHERQDRRLSKSEWCPDRTHDQHDWDDDYSAYTSASSNMSDRRYGNRISTKESMNLRSSTGGLGQSTDSRSFDFYRHASDGDRRYADEEREEDR
ncbi:hypothetical protein THAOC_17991, partial [Thalassiosira oceanica]